MIVSPLLSKIKMVAPGTHLRRTLDEIVKADFGSLLIFLDDMEKHKHILQGGFHINCEFSRQKLYELSKMDGAIVVNENVSRIYKANVHLIPDPSIPTEETGMRHRTAERMAKYTGKLAVAISRRRKTITIYFQNFKHQLNDLNYLITRVNLTLATLEKKSEEFNQLIYDITLEELESQVKLGDVVQVVLKAQEIMKIIEEIEPYVLETGSEGYLSSQQLDYISSYIRCLLKVFIMDYSVGELKDYEVSYMIKAIKQLDQTDTIVIAKMLGWDLMNEAELDTFFISPRCYRLLTSVANIPMGVARNVIKKFDNMSKIKNADIHALQEVEGIGEKRAHAIIRSIHTIKKRTGFR